MIGFEMMEEDHYVYVIRSRKSLLILSLYVDDILLAINDIEMIVTTKRWLSFIFEMKDMGEACLELRFSRIAQRTFLVCLKKLT